METSSTHRTQRIASGTDPLCAGKSVIAYHTQEIVFRLAVYEAIQLLRSNLREYDRTASRYLVYYYYVSLHIEASALVKALTPPIKTSRTGMFLMPM